MNNYDDNKYEESRRCPTVSEWFHSDKCNYKKRPVQGSTLRAHDCIFANHIESYIGEMPLNIVKRINCFKIIKDMKDTNIPQGTQFGTYAVLTRIFRSALDYGWIDAESYPCEGLQRFVNRIEVSHRKA